MKRLFVIWGLALALLPACTKQVEEFANVPVILEVAVADDGLFTRAADNIQSTQLDRGERFTAILTGCTRDRVTFEMNANQVTASVTGGIQPPFLKMGAQDTTVRAIYPYTYDINSNTWTVQLNQSDTAGYKASDLMYASATNIGSNGRANITFQHRMAKIIVKATGGPEIEINAVRIISGKKTVSLYGNDLMPQTPSGDISNTPAARLSLLEGANASYIDCAALIPPQTIPTSVGFLEVECNKGTCWFQLFNAKGDSVTFESGRSYTLVLPIENTMLGLTSTVTAWVHAPEMAGYTEF